ncbi:RNA-binding protein [Pseudoalteromonas lipolytica SCSIO 04301]|uniref:RNA-binding protein n=1 Tax=Pseudoalteromonas lipolytica TaxID=570156 RepID=A0ABY1GLE4_9GAMM|nr:DUF4124 domain-containing protein [Pseudoalteromonas lipolytica]EWH04080.1 RNA-binding protein [Pseudoalteromonas lipolytica SCSIO 04301]MBE0352477.1 hypothetical protein [Pseudoalteromonas lipolytica LMEB 39]SFT93137.1 hypothetical protein SAMN04487854_11721 [Pseudoalteromonas lipolytica]
MSKLTKKILATVILASFSSQATVYKCMIKGVATFSEQPCGKDATIIKINLPPKQLTDNTKKQPELSVDDYLQVQEIDRKIQQLELERKNLKQQQRERIEKLKLMTQDAANRLGADSINDAISKQSKRINSYYENQLTQFEQQIKQLEERKKQLKGTQTP